VSATLPAELARLGESMRAAGLDFLVLASPANVTYACGFEAPLPVGFVADVTRSLPAVAVVAADAAGALVVNDAVAASASDSWIADVSTFETLGHLHAADPSASFSAAVAAVLRSAGLAGSRSVIGVEPTLPRIVADALEAGCPGAELRDCTDAVEAARRIKTEREIALLRRAVAVADEGQRRLLELASSSAETTDTALWAECAGAIQRLAGRNVPVAGTAVTGEATADWTAVGPLGRAVSPGDPVLLDIGPRLDGYWADCANTVVFGAEPTSEQLHYLEASREACLAGVEALRPGRACVDAWEAVRATLERHGISMSHYAGHEVGVTVNEPPRLVPYDRTPIEPGMVFALEAGAYAGPAGAVGARSERVVLVTERGPEILSRFEWEP
jgi:Xaa-Pro aminopeptidase